MRLGHGNTLAKAGRPQPIGVHVNEELAAALPVLGERADLHDLTLRANRDISICAVVRAGDDLGSDEAADLPEPRYGRSGSHDRTSAIENQPDLALAGRNRRLVDESKQAASLPTRREALLRWLRDACDDAKVEAAVGAEGNGDLDLDVEEVGHEEVAVIIERQAGVATCVSQVVVVPDQLRGPGLAAIEAHALEQPGRRLIHVRNDHDVLRIGRVDRHCLLGLVGKPLADIDVGWVFRDELQLPAGPSGASRSGNKRGDDKTDRKAAVNWLRRMFSSFFERDAGGLARLLDFANGRWCSSSWSESAGKGPARSWRA